MKAISYGTLCLSLAGFALTGCALKPLSSASAPDPIPAPISSPPSAPSSISESAPTVISSPTSAQMHSMNTVRMQPAVHYGGELVGFRLYPGRDRIRFSCLGLEPGDLLQSMNETSFKRKRIADADLDSFIQQASNSFDTNTSASIQVLRGKDPNATEINFRVNEKCVAAR